MKNKRLPVVGDTVRWNNWHKGLLFDKPEWVVEKISGQTETACTIWLVNGPDYDYGWMFTLEHGNWTLIEPPSIEPPTETMFQIQSKTWPGVAKFIEESSELNVNFAKLMATGGKSEYWGDVDLKTEIEDELADVFAAYLFIIEANPELDRDRMTRRTYDKLIKYAEWRRTGQG